MQAKQKWDALWVNGVIYTGERNSILFENGAIAVKAGKIAWMGDSADLPATPTSLAHVVHDLQGCLLTPGLIDCHTHVIFAGNRANEFAWRLQGKTYVEIAELGGGIQSTVKATRAASEETLLQQSLLRARALLASGVTTIEIKSGYGLDVETELKMLRVAKRIGEQLPMTVIPTFLGAHTIPLEYQSDRQAYVDFICKDMIPKIAEEKLAKAVDVFCEKIAFNLAETKQIFIAAKAHQLAIKCHAEQLSNSESATLAATFGAASVDHLEFISEKSVMALGKSDTVAVLLPSAFYFLRDTYVPPINWLRQYGVKMAIASDCNPGTSPVLSLPIAMNMACVLFKLTPQEVLLGVTHHAACALQIDKTVGTLTTGKIADFVIWQAKHPDELCYYLGGNLVSQIVKEGQVVSV